MKKMYLLIGCMVVGMLTLGVPNVLSAKMMDTKSIRLRAKKPKVGDIRTVLPVCAWFEDTENVVNVAFLDSPALAIVTLYDQDGNVVISKEYQSPQTVSIPFDKQNGEYRIEITCDTKAFEGSFVF